MMNVNLFSRRILIGAACLGTLTAVTGSAVSAGAAPLDRRSDRQEDDRRRDDRRDDDRRRDDWRHDDDRDKGRFRKDDRTRPGWDNDRRRPDGRWDNGRRPDGRWDNDRWDNDRWDNDRWNGGWGSGGYRGGVTWSDIDRRPSIDWNSPAGFYVWRDRDDIYIVANDRDRGRRGRYSGEISIQNGSLNRVDGFDTEGSDRVQQLSDSRARFEFETNDDRDGMKFHVESGSRIVITLRGDSGNGDRIYLGRDRTPSRQNPLVIVR